MSEWYIQHDEETEIGPLQSSELLELVRTGVITEETPCRKGDSAWFYARDVGGLFRAAKGQIAGYRCPYCQKSVSEPPTYCKGCDRYIDEANEIYRDATGRKVKGTKDFDAPKESFKSWGNWVTRLKEQREARSRDARPRYEDGDE